MITKVENGRWRPWDDPEGGEETMAGDTRKEIDQILDRVIELARRRGYTQETLEVAANLPRNRISKWRDRTRKRPELQVTYLHRIARTLGVPMEYFLEDTSIDEALGSDMDYVIYTAKKLGTEEAIRRLLDDRYCTASAAEPAAPETDSGQSLHPPVRPASPHRRAKGA